MGHQMNLVLNRQPSNDSCTHGDLFVGDDFECVTLEDIVREVKIPGETAIPAGRYRVVITYSNRFKRDLPLLLDVPNFTGVRIHSGNTAAQTEGCLLVGKERGPTTVMQSRAALLPLQAKIQKALDYGDPVYINIHNAKEVL